MTERRGTRGAACARCTVGGLAATFIATLAIKQAGRSRFADRVATSEGSQGSEGNRRSQWKNSASSRVLSKCALRGNNSCRMSVPLSVVRERARVPNAARVQENAAGPIKGEYQELKPALQLNFPIYTYPATSILPPRLCYSPPSPLLSYVYFSVFFLLPPPLFILFFSFFLFLLRFILFYQQPESQGR